MRESTKLKVEDFVSCRFTVGMVTCEYYGWIEEILDNGEEEPVTAMIYTLDRQKKNVPLYYCTKVFYAPRVADVNEALRYSLINHSLKYRNEAMFMELTKGEKV